MQACLFLWHIISLFAGSKSRDAKSCVSQGGKAFVSSIFIACVYCNGLFGRRKILRLYWADAIKYIRKNQGYYMRSTKVETQNFASHEGKSIYSSAYNCLQDCYGVDGRRKILRLYKQGKHLFPAYSSHAYVAMDCSGDARFCVSTGRTPLSILGKIKDIICIQQK